MALVLKRIVNPYEAVRCSVTKEWIMYPDYYYEDDVTGEVVSFEYYYDEKMRRRLERNQPILDRALNGIEYKLAMKEAEREYLQKTLFERPIFDNNDIKDRGDE